jgi:hypothetical protein
MLVKHFLQIMQLVIIIIFTKIKDGIKYFMLPKKNAWRNPYNIFLHPIIIE